MAELRRIVWLALIAGVFAGVVVTAAQWFTTIPLILAAERYEHAEGAEPASPAPVESVPEHAHEHGHAEDGALSRTGNTLLFNVLAGVGFGLLLSALLTTLGTHGAGRGLLLGLGGFLAAGLAPALGLPPELPGMVAAPLVDRQLWWVGATVASAIGLALLVFGRRNLLRVIAIALLAAPHLIGAPEADLVQAGGPPVELHQRFIAASLGTTALFWLVLGATLGWLHARGVAGTRRVTAAVTGSA
jgi:cobalt transporter subunit CbtA